MRLIAIVPVSALLACSGGVRCEQRLKDAQDSPDARLQAALVDVSCDRGSAATSGLLVGAANAELNAAADKVAVFEGSAERLVWSGGARALTAQR